MDRLEAMSTFLAVADAGGFSAAARESGTPLPTVSRRVAELEAALGVRLLNRTTRRVELTDTGRTFYAACRRVFDDLRDADDTIRGEYRVPRGELVVTAPMGFGRLHLQPVALDFLAAYPEINLRFVLVDRVANLLEEHIDAAVRIGDLPDSSLVARPLGEVRMVVCASPAYLATHGAPRHPDDLRRLDCIAWSALSAASAWRFHEGGRDRTFPIRTRLATTMAESAVAAAEAGLGLVQATSYQVERGVAEGRLAVVLDDFECAAWPVSLVHASNRLVPLKLRVFLDFVAPRLRERLRSIAEITAAGRNGPRTAGMSA